jgi:hypothetical protein
VQLEVLKRKVNDENKRRRAMAKLWDFGKQLKAEDRMDAETELYLTERLRALGLESNEVDDMFEASG